MANELTPEMRRLIVAAREVAYDDRATEEMVRELDHALEPFAIAVAWREQEGENV